MLKHIYNQLPSRLQPLAEGLYETLNYTEETPLDTIGDFLDNDSPVVVDGGAHEGETISKCLAVFDSPQIYAFEPNPDKFQLLERIYANNKDITIFNKALANSEGTVKMNILSESDMSSILDPTMEYLATMGDGVSTKNTVEVPTVPLDNVIDKDVDVLKLDLQGYEYDALQGASELLESVSVVSCEVVFKIHYEGQTLFCGIDEFLSDSGFVLFDLFNLKYDTNGRLRHAQALYIDETEIPNIFN